MGILSALIIYTCLAGQGCSESGSAYLLANPQVKDNILLLQRKLEYTVGEKTVGLLAPFIGLLATKEAEMKITPNLGFKMNFKENNNEYIGLEMTVKL